MLHILHVVHIVYLYISLIIVKLFVRFSRGGRGLTRDRLVFKYPPDVRLEQIDITEHGITVVSPVLHAPGHHAAGFNHIFLRGLCYGCIPILIHIHAISVLRLPVCVLIEDHKHGLVHEIHIRHLTGLPVILLGLFIHEIGCYRITVEKLQLLIACPGQRSLSDLNIHLCKSFRLHGHHIQSQYLLHPSH